MLKSLAQKRLLQFCIINNIALNQEILEIPVKGIDDFFKNRDQSGENLSKEEVLDDLADSESMIIIDDITLRPVILVDEAKMFKLDTEDQVQIIIHEYLHFYDVINSYFFFETYDFSSDSVDDEAEDELISILISKYYDKTIEEGLYLLNRSINSKKLLEAYNDKEIPKSMLKKLHTIGETDILRRLQVREFMQQK